MSTSYELKYVPTQKDFKYFTEWYAPGGHYHQPEYAGTIFDKMTYADFVRGWLDMIAAVPAEFDGYWMPSGPGTEMCVGSYKSFGSWEREMLRDHFRTTLGLPTIGFI